MESCLHSQDVVNKIVADKREETTFIRAITIKKYYLVFTDGTKARVTWDEYNRTKIGDKKEVSAEEQREWM